MKLVVTIPAYNEEKTIESVIRSIPKKIQGIQSIQIVVTDDGSTDRTAAISKKCGVIVLHNKKNFGLAYSFNRSMDFALSLGADVIVNTDADNQYDQQQIPLLVKPIVEHRADMVLGSRFLGTIESMPWQKRFGNQLATKTLAWVTGLNISDGQTGFRSFSREAALRMNLFSKFTYTHETLLEAAEKRLVIKEIPVTFRKRGDSSRLFSSVFSYAKRSAVTLVAGILNYKPFQFFVGLGAVFLLLGAFFGWRVLSNYLGTGQVSPYLPSAVLSSLLVLAGIQCWVTAFLAEMIKRNRLIQESQLYNSRKLLYKK